MHNFRNTFRNRNLARLALVFLLINLVMQVALDLVVPPTAHAAGATLTVDTGTDPTNGGGRRRAYDGW